MDVKKNILEEITYDNRLADAGALAVRIAGKYRECKAVCESTGSMWIKTFEGFEKAGIPITLANTPKLKIISQAGTKTDGVDARVLARLLSSGMVPACHVPERRVRSKKQILRHRIALVRDRTRVSNRAGRLLDKYDVTLQGGRMAGARNLRMLSDAPLQNPDDESVLHQIVREIRNINEEIAAVDGRIRETALESEDAKLIMSMPGLDAFGAMPLALEIDGIGRFKGPKQLIAWAGLCPTVSQSGRSSHHGRMRKDSNRRANWIMNQAAHTAVRCDARMKAVYERARKAHPHPVAISHVSHKMPTIIWHMLQNRATYDGKKDALYARKLERLKA